MKFSALLAATLVAGCTPAPQNIKPVTRDYQPLLVEDCVTLMAREAATQSELDRYSSLQSNNRIVDVFETLTTIFGDGVAWRSRKKDAANERTIARLSGELEALQAARAVRCGQGPTSSS